MRGWVVNEGRWMAMEETSEAWVIHRQEALLAWE